MPGRVRRSRRHPDNGGLFPVGDAPVSAPVMSTDDGCTHTDVRAKAAGSRDKDRGLYADFYRALGGLREEFHRIGRFDDANAKLDELCKLLILKVLDTRCPPSTGRSRLSLPYLAELAECRHGNPGRLAAALHDVHEELSSRFPEEIEAFGLRRGLNMDIDDDEFARALIPLLESLPTQLHQGDRFSFDTLNEAFGHFVQDSFRNRKEDAQYMTPPEVVSAAVEMAFTDMLHEFRSSGLPDTLLVADPTCGVGSFLAAAYRHAAHTEVPEGNLADRLELFGQDKVERMVRLAVANLRIFARAAATVRQGNSILPPSTLDDISGKVDIVLTNPPFGAAFDTAEVLGVARPEHFPVLCDLASAKALPRTVDSEYLLLDREAALLKPGGRLLMVVPDHVVSGTGFPETFRRALLRHVDLVAVLELPTETFAQAGTRTKTSIVYLRRPRSGNDNWRPRLVFMAVAEDLGFRVVTRKGASVKKIVGHCDLDRIVEVHRVFRSTRRQGGGMECLSESPSVSAVPVDMLLGNGWTARFYTADRLAALGELSKLPKQGFDVRSLPDIAEIDSEIAERVFPDDTNRCVSVLHVREDGCIDLQAVADYRPSTACVRCRAGDVLLSKINPRIPRVCVVPDTQWSLGCSPEFAVLRPKLPRLSSWELVLLLRSSVVQRQLRTLTSGTSSSHNRVKDRDLRAVKVPVPKPGTHAAEQLATLGHVYEKAATEQYDSLGHIARCLGAVDELFGSE